MRLKQLTGLVCAVLLAACATEVPPVSPQAIAQARSQGTLEALYQQVTADIAREGISRKSKTALETQQREIGGLLADARIAEIESALAAYGDLAPLSALDEATRRAEPVRQWHPGRHASLSASLRDQQQATQRAIDERLLQANAIGTEDGARKIQLLDELVALSGGEAAQLFAQQKGDFVETLYSSAVTAVERAQFEEARQLLLPVAAVDPDYKGIRDLQLHINASLFEKRFYDALGQGRPEEAYKLFVELAESPGFDLVRDQIAPTADELAKYFVLLGDKQRKQDGFESAFQSFRYARYIRNHLGKTASYTKEETAFIGQLDALFGKARKEEDTALAYGYLLAIEALDPMHATLKRNMRMVREEALVEAKIKMATMPMGNSNANRAYGSGLASKVSQYLLDKIPGDVDIIERAQFDNIIGKVKRPDASTYLSYYYVQGEILESGVDTSEKTANRQVRVVTDYNEVPNPDYEKWAKLSSSARKSQPEPAPTVKVPVKENVTIKGVAIKKVGVFSVTFRLVDPFSSKVLFVDSVTEKATVEGENVEGMDIGEFRQEARMADLPSDSEMLEALADKIAELVGDRLIAELQNPEQHYREYGIRAIHEDKIRAAAINLGYATLLNEQKATADAAVVREEFLAALMRSSQ